MHLRRGVQLHGQSHTPQRHVLHDERIHACGDELAGLPFGIGELVVVEQRVERRMHPHAEAAGIRHDAGDLLRRVARGLPRAEARAADVDGVGAGLHGSHGRGIVFRRGEQFDGFHASERFRIAAKVRKLS